MNRIYILTIRPLNPTRVKNNSLFILTKPNKILIQFVIWTWSKVKLTKNITNFTDYLQINKKREQSDRSKLGEKYRVRQRSIT